MTLLSPGRRGVALIMVIVILMALVAIATPFAVSMQLQEKASRTLFYQTQARIVAEGARNYAVAQLYRTHETLEKAGANPAPFNTPDWDSPEEFRVEMDLARRSDLAQGVDFSFVDPRGILWSVEIEDEQAKVNLNSCSPWLLGNLLGSAMLVEDLSADGASMTVDDASGFFTDDDASTVDGYVLVEREAVSYKSVRGNVLEGCERGVLRDQFFTAATKHKKNNLVVDYRASKVAGFPVARSEAHVPYLSLSDLRRVSEAAPTGDGLTGLVPSEIDRLKPLVTIYSHRELREGWTSPVRVNSVTFQDTADTADVLVVANVRQMSAGTLLKIVRKASAVAGDQSADTDRTVEYARVSEIRQTREGAQVALDRKLQMLYKDGDTWEVQPMMRHPVNVNTAPRAVMRALLCGLKRLQDRGFDNPETGEEVKPSVCVTPAEADAVIAAIDAFRDENGNFSPLRCHEDLQTVLQSCMDGNAISQSSMDTILLNARSANDWRMLVSTAPFCYKSFDTYTIEASGVVNAPSGKEVASHRFREVVQLAPPQTAALTLESQYDFHERILAPQGRKVGTWPNPTAIVGVYPEYSRDPGTGDVRLESAQMFGGSGTTQTVSTGGGSAFVVQMSSGLQGYVEHFDRQLIEGYEMTPEGPRLAGTGLPPFTAQQTRFGPDPAMQQRDCKAGTVELWFKPSFDDKVAEPQVLFDMAEDPAVGYTNRIAMFYDPETKELVLRLADGTYEPTAAEVRASAADLLKKDTWYHLSGTWKSTRHGEMSLLVDGKPAGRFVHRTQAGQVQTTVLTQDLASDSSATITVENANGFPSTGVLLIGREAIEYTARTGSTFSYTPYPEFDPNAQSGSTGQTYTPQDPNTPQGGGAGTGGTGGATDKQEGGSTGTPSVPGGTVGGATGGATTFSRDVSVGRAKRGSNLAFHPSGAAVTVYGYYTDLGTKIPVGGSTSVGAFGAKTRTHTLMPWEKSSSSSGGSGGSGGTTPGGGTSPGGGGGPVDGFLQAPSLPPIVVITPTQDEIRVDSAKDFPDKGYLLLAKFYMQAATDPNQPSTPGAGTGGGGTGGTDRQEGGTPTNPGGGTSTPGGTTASEELQVQYEMVYYGEKDDSTFKKIERAQLGTKAQEFTDRWVDIFLMSVGIADSGDYETSGGRVQVDNEWFRYNVILEEDGAKYLVRDFKDVVAELLEIGSESSDGLTAEPVDPNAPPDPNNPNPTPATYTEVNFKGYEFRCYNRTILAKHETGKKIIPVFEVANPVCGRLDGVTLLTQQNGAVSAHATAMVNWADDKYVAFMDFLGEAFAKEYSRLLKFPSGETAGRLDGSVRVGAPVSGAGTAGTVDEVRFATANRAMYRLAGIVSESATELQVQPPSAEAQVTVVVQGGTSQGGQPPILMTVSSLDIPNCGILKLGDEYVGYSERDNNVLRNLKRGMLGSTPAVHDDGEFVMHLAFMTNSALAESVTQDGNALPLASTQAFPAEGYVLIGDELIGYSRKDPQRLLIASENPDSKGLFRGAFGTCPRAHDSGDMAVLMPFRYFDGFRENADVPEMAYFQASFSAAGAYWDRVLWDQLIPQEVYQQVRVYVRVDGKPSWNEEPTNKPGGLYCFTNPAAENILGAQGDSIEVRVYFVYNTNAYSTGAWKSTPVLRNLQVRYAQPLRVFLHEELPR